MIARVLPLAALLCAAPLSAQAPPGPTPGRTPTLTRLVHTFLSLETELLEALQRKDQGGVEKLLLDDFEMRSAEAPGEPTPRAEWIRASLGAGPARIGEMAVRKLGGSAIVSFRYAPSGQSQGYLFVDVWVETEGGFKLAARYGGPAEASRRTPGAVPPSPAPERK